MKFQSLIYLEVIFRKVLLGDLTESLFLPLRKFQSNSWMILANLGGAIDAGGPRREFLTLIFEHLRNSPLFLGEDNRKFLSCFAQNMEDGDYFLAGQISAITLVHWGPPPHLQKEIYMM